MYFEKSHAQSQSVAGYDAQLLAEAVRSVRDLLPMCDDERPVFGVILGSERGLAADRLLAAGGKSLAYPAILGMPLPLVVGHPGRLVLGRNRRAWQQGPKDGQRLACRVAHAASNSRLIFTLCRVSTGRLR